MFKSKSHRNILFQNNYESTYKYQSKIQLENDQAKLKKTFVKFDTETIQKEDKPNGDLDCSNYKRRQKSCNTWALISNTSDKDLSDNNTPKYNILKQHNSYDTTNQSNSKNFINQKLFASSYHRPKQYQNSYQNYSNTLKVPDQFSNQKKLGLSKQCKSMKTLPIFNAYDDEQPAKVKRNIKFQAYNSLLKSSQQLLSKYKRIDQEKNKLRENLKQQKEENSKSSKRICLAQEKEQQREQNKYNYYKKQQKQYVKEARPKSNYQKSYEYNNKYQKKIQPSYLPKQQYNNYYEKSSTNKTFKDNFNKTFTYTKKQQSPKYVPQMDSNSYTSGFNTISRNKLDTKTSLNDFQLGKCLGQGAFGQVFPARHKKSNMMVAIKKVKKQSVKHMLDQFIQEIKIQMFLDHPNIVKLYGFFDDYLHFYIIMEYMEGGSLYTYVKKNKNLTLEETSSKLRQVCEGLKHMHDNSILHRDIKPQNVVMTNNVCKLCDFGWSAVCKDRRTTYCGTLDYVSPQIIQGEGYDDCVDIWCVGVLTYELLVGKTPFYNISRKQTMKKIMDCSLQYPQSLPQVAVSFMKRILRKNPQQRTDIDKILQDPFMKLGIEKNYFQ